MWYYVIYWYKTKTKHCSLSSLHCTKWEWRKLHVFLLKKITGSGGASAQILKKRKLLYLMHKNPPPIAKKNNQIHMLHSSILAKTRTANWNVSCLERLITPNTQNTGLRLRFPEFWEYRINQQHDTKNKLLTCTWNFLISLFCDCKCFPRHRSQFSKLWLALATSFNFHLQNGSSANCKSRTAAKLIRDGGSTSADTLPVPRWMLDATLKCCYYIIW